MTSIAGPLFKVDWPGAPVSQFSQRDKFGADYTYAQQQEVLERGLELARAFRTDRLRCFDFWRLDDPKPYRAAMDEELRKAAVELFAARGSMHHGVGYGDSDERAAIGADADVTVLDRLTRGEISRRAFMRSITTTRSCRRRRLAKSWCRSATALSPRALIINSFSKYYCMTGWRVGWVIAPAALTAAVGARGLDGRR